MLVPARGKVVERILVLGQPTEVEANDGTVPETQASVHARKIGDDSSSQANPAPTLESVMTQWSAVCLSSDWEPLMPACPA